MREIAKTQLDRMAGVKKPIAKKSKSNVKKSAVTKTDRSNNILWDRNLNRLEEYLRSVVDLYDDYFDANPDWNERESELYNGIDNLFDELETMMEAYVAFLGSHIYKASTKKSKVKKSAVKKSLSEILSAYDSLSEEDKERLQAGLDELCTGFSIRSLLAGDYSPEEDDDYDASTKKSMKKSRKMRKAEEESEEEEEEYEEDESDDDDVEVEVEVDKRTRKRNDIRKPDDIALGECKGCSKRTRKAEMPDADDQQNDNEPPTANSDELPEDADDQQEENQGDSSNEDNLPEDADDQQKEKQSSRRKNMRKFSVTDRGSERYDGRQNYNQSPMMREGIDRSFKAKGTPESELTKSLNARLSEINKNKRNKSNTSVPMRIKNH